MVSLLWMVHCSHVPQSGIDSLSLFCLLQKWSKGKVRDKLNNMILFDKPTYDKFYKEVPTWKLITPAVVSERLKVRGSLARKALKEMEGKGLIKLVDHHTSLTIYTRKAKDEHS